MRSVMRVTAVVIVSLAAGLSLAAPGQRPKPGLTVIEGKPLLKGKPFRGVGANYFSLFSRVLKDPNDRSSQAGLGRLAQAKIPFVRFMASGFWPVDWDLYLLDKGEYFRRLDGIVRCAEETEIGLIPSLFWYLPTVPDIVGEPMDQLGNPNSKSVTFIRQYTREVVLRYRDSAAIWGWELGNEYNLRVDLPNANEHRPPVWPRLKTALTRTARDDFSSRAMLTVFAEFARTVRQYDRRRVLMTGNSLPRPSAYHNSTEKSWTEDTVEQFAEILQRDNPDPFDTLSVHVYPKSVYPGQAKTLADLIKTVSHLAARAGKPLFIGEFGVPRARSPGQAQREFVELLTAIEVNKVPLSALWVYDHPGQERDWNVTFANGRKYMLQLIVEANQRMAKERQDSMQ